ncbi:MAG: hypothetical protein Q614_SASC00340G0001, partial [Staphylococcus sp. DORA_6_22]
FEAENHKCKVYIVTNYSKSIMISIKKALHKWES